MRKYFEKIQHIKYLLRECLGGGFWEDDSVQYIPINFFLRYKSTAELENFIIIVREIFCELLQIVKEIHEIIQLNYMLKEIK